MTEVPKTLAGLTWRDISRLQNRAQRKIMRREELTADERRVWEYVTRTTEDQKVIAWP